MRPRRGRARVWILRGPSPGSELCLLTVTQCVWPAVLAVRPGAAASAALAEGPTRWPAPGVDGSASAFCSLSTPSRSAGVWRERMLGASLTASVFTGVTTAPGPPPAPACSRAVCSGQVPRAGREPDALRLRGWILPLGLDRGNNSGPSSLMLALRFHKNYMESYKRVIKPPRFAAQWKSCPRKDFIRLSRRFQGPAVLLADRAMKKQ